MAAPDRHSRLAELFHAALEVSAAQRETYLKSACGEDAGLLQELRSLLQHHERDGGDVSGALDRPILDRPVDIRAVISAVDQANAPGELPLHIPGYRVLSVLGEGGMGVVYLAEQDKPRRRVAIKLMRPGVTSPALLKRFDLEQEMLGRLQHPGIAQIFGAGVCQPFGDSGPSQPFFAMEYVEGLALNEYCRSHNLGTRQRMRLLLMVCDAVQHAHAKGVIHRDLKPGNILVEDGIETSLLHGLESQSAAQTFDGTTSSTSMPRPKILDFGVARATGSDVQVTTLHTGVGQLIGTLAYMSPEQAAGDPSKIDARSDIYALGVIGYELLAGQLPLHMQGKGVADAARIVRDEDPTPLSSINRVFRGDLDTIFAKALAKEPLRRYQSAAEFAADIQRFLDDQPLIARPPSTIYNLSKFARRNKGLVAGVALAFVVLVVGVVGTTIGMVRAHNAQGTAQVEAETVQAVSDFIQEMLASADPLARTGASRDDPRQTRVIDVLDHASELASERFADRPLVEAGVRSMLGRTYSHLMDFDNAERETLRARDIYVAQLGEEHFKSLDAMSAVGTLYMMQHRFDDAEKIKRRAIELGKRVRGPADSFTLGEMEQLALMQVQRMNYDDGLALLEELLAQRRSADGPDDPETLNTLYNVSWTLVKAGRFDDALPRAIEVLELRRSLVGDDDPVVFSDINNVAFLKQRLGQADQAEGMLVDLVAKARTHLPPGDWRLGTFLHNLSSARRELKEYAEAEPCELEAIEIFLNQFGQSHERTRQALKGAVTLYSEWGRPDEADKWRAMLAGERRETPATAAESTTRPDAP